MTDVAIVDVLGVRISTIDQERARETLFDAVRIGRRGYVTVTGVHGVMEAQKDEGFRAILNNAILTRPDGSQHQLLPQGTAQRG